MPAIPGTDFASHHIEGYARAAIEQGKDGHFNVPLITEILPGLWQGGCIDGVPLPADFDLVISLYPWEAYKVAPGTRVISVTAYDSHDVPDVAALAEETHKAWKDGQKVLVHCQAGLNRSGLIAAQILIRDGHTPQDAIRLLRDKRCSMVLCNPAFERHLLGDADTKAAA